MYTLQPNSDTQRGVVHLSLYLACTTGEDLSKQYSGVGQGTNKK